MVDRATLCCCAGELAMIYFQYLLCMVAIVFAGIRLARYGDLIGEKTGIAKGFIGLTMLAGVTSLPELAIGISSVTVHQLPEIAVGDIMGSCLFNLAILAGLDFFSKGQRLVSRVQQSHMLPAACGIILLSLACASQLRPVPAIGWISAASIALFGIYMLSMKLAFKLGVDPVEAGEQEKESDDMPLRQAVLLYAVHAAIVLVAGVWMPAIAGEIAAQTGLHQGFVGTTFVALSTSLPEVVITYGAVRINSFDMAVGNVLGSNLFNMMVLAIDDFAFLRGPIFDLISQSHAITALGAILMTAIFIADLAVRSTNKRLPLSSGPIAMLIAFALTLLAAYTSPEEEAQARLDQISSRAESTVIKLERKLP
jgi:cation:H+ antiporter